MREHYTVAILVAFIVFVVIVVFHACEAQAAGSAIEQARKHARNHATYLNVKFPKRLQTTDSIRELRRYINATWQRMRYPRWRSLGAKAWLPLARHAGWPASIMPTLERIIFRESRGQPGAVLTVHRGLLQIRADHAPGCDLFNPYTNLRVGLMLYHRSGLQPWACTAY